MVSKRLPASDPRTIARDIPGFFEALFPHLAQGVVSSLNRRSVRIPECIFVTAEEISSSELQKAMLFEVAVAAAEQLIQGREDIDWKECLDLAVARQRMHFDARIPESLTVIDREISLRVGQNLQTMIGYIAAKAQGEVSRSPLIPGYQWIASGVGDFCVGASLIEVKCTGRHFSSSDYRQILMYWILSYAAAIEGRGQEFVEGILVNPRLNLLVKFSFTDLVALLGAGKSKVELLETFSCMVAERSAQLS